MRLYDYISEKGLSPRLVAQALGISKQTLNKYGRDSEPTLATLKKISIAMTDMGVPTTVIELYSAISGEKK